MTFGVYSQTFRGYTLTVSCFFCRSSFMRVVIVGQDFCTMTVKSNHEDLTYLICGLKFLLCEPKASEKELKAPTPDFLHVRLNM